jgi:hypothetical protein
MCLIFLSKYTLAMGLKEAIEWYLTVHRPKGNVNEKILLER